MSSELIESSLAAVAERVGDPAPQVYARLFEMAPELQPLFVRDTDGSVRAEMLARALETLLDLVGEGHYARGLIATEFVNHQNIGVPADRFGVFFDAMISTFREVLADAWTDDVDAAWDALRGQVGGLIARHA